MQSLVRAVLSLTLFQFLLMSPCLAEASKLKNPFEASGEKIRLFTEDTKSSVREIAALIDEACELKNISLGKSSLPIPLENQPGFGRRSRVVTHKFDLLPTGTALLDVLERDPCVLGVSANQTASAEEIPNDPLLARQPHLSAVEFLPSLDFFAQIPDGKPAVVAVIDTGIELNHEDLRANLWVNEREANGKAGVDDDGNGYVDDVYGYNFVAEIGDPSHQTPNDHGTHVAGLVAASLGNGFGGAGIAGLKAKVMALNVFGGNWGTETIYIDRAIRYAADNGANVINISINGGGESDTTAAAIVYAIERGLTVVVSAGNQNQDIATHFTFPASYASRYPGLVSVGAIDAETKGRCPFSNFNPERVKLAAPGCMASASQNGIYSTRKNNSYGYKAGTSMAAPIVAGAAALAFLGESERQGFAPSANTVEALLLQGSDPRPDLEGFFAGGRSLNLLRLMEELKKGFPAGR